MMTEIMTDTNIKIGKNILENLTIGMYTDSRFIYREYIQNAADAIDEAIKNNIQTKDNALINIDICPEKRTVIIEDNATGISKNKAPELLGNIADSIKDKNINKGFRGIGRLGGLAYCNKLIFETSVINENVKTIMTWDAELLQKILNNPQNNMDAISVVRQIITVEEKPEESNKHYFKVILQNINQSNSQLLNLNDIREYLSLVAPIPFSKTQFYVCSDIYNYIKNNQFNLDEYKIRINGENLYKAYNIGLFEANDNNTNKKRYDDITGVEFKEFYDTNNELLAWSWIGISRFEKNIPEKNNPARGIRLKKQNIQFGDSSTLNKLHKETRGNGYFIGEVHAVHKDLIPNARRDYFNQNDTLNLFEQKLREYFNQLYKLYHDANAVKNALKKQNELVVAEEEYLEKEKKGFIDKEEKTISMKKIEEARKKAEQAQKDLSKIKERTECNPTLNKVFTAIEKEHEIKDSSLKIKISFPSNQEKKDNYRSSNLNKLNRESRKLVGEIYKIILSVLDPETAESVIKKIEEKYM